MKNSLKILLRTIFCFCILIGTSCLLTACDWFTTAKDPITITFETNIGTLSFNTKTLTDNTLSESDCPTVTYDGNDYIFDRWTTENGQTFNFSSNIKQSTTLFAKFEESELVCCTRWVAGQSLAGYRGYYLSTVDRAFSSSSLSIVKYSDKKIDTIKMAKKDIKDEYITLDEFYELSDAHCFVTTVDQPTILKESDLTSNIYTCVTFDVFENKAYGRTEYVLADNPLMLTAGNAIDLVYWKNERTSSISHSFSGSGILNTRVLEFDGNLPYSAFSFEQINTYKKLSSCTESDFKAGKTYYLFSILSSAEYLVKENNETLYCIFDKYGNYHSKVSKAQADALQQL